MKKLIPILIILSLISPTLVQLAQAGPLDSTIGFSSCAAGGFISNLIGDGLVKLEKTIKEGIANWLRRKGIIPLPGEGFGQFLPGTTVPVSDAATQARIDDFRGQYTAKENVEDLVARCAAREILTAMGRNITNVARTGGRDGGPAWVRNWRNFKLDSQYRGEGIFRGILASTNLCKYFEPDLKSTFQANRRVNLTQIKTRSDFDSFQVKAGCTLPNNFSFEDYKKDFSGNGGWEAWSRLIEPQNNYYGAFFLSLDEMNRQKTIEETAALNEAGPTGFTSVRGRNAADSCAVRSPYAGGGCLVYKDILTPSKILSGAVEAGFEAELQWVATTDEFSELIATGIEVLFNRLWDLSNPDEGDYIVPGSTDADVNFPEPIPPGGPGSEPDPLGACLQECDTTYCSIDNSEFTCRDLEYNSCINDCFNAPGNGTNDDSGTPASLLADVQSERAKYGATFAGLCDNSGDVSCPLGTILNAVAWKNRDSGWMLLGKDSGYFCATPNGARISCDILVHEPTLKGYDVFIDAEGSATPTWDGPDPFIPGFIKDGSRTLVSPVQP